MKVAVFAYTNDEPTLDTGVTTYNQHLVRALCTRFPQHSFTVYLAPRNSAKFADIEAPNLRKVVIAGGPEWAASPFGGGGGKLASALALLRFGIREMLHRCGVRAFPMRESLFDTVEGLRDHDVVLYTVFGYFPEFPLYVGRKFHIPCVSAIHDIRVLYDEETKGQRVPWHVALRVFVYRYILGRVVRESLRTLVPSNHIRGVLVSLHARSADRICVSYVVPDELAPPDVSLPPAVKQILETRPRFIFYPSTIVATKNHMMLARAIDRLRRDVPEILLLLAGSNRDSEMGRELFRYVEEQGMQKNIVHLGFISEGEKTALYRSAAALVVPSIGESFSLPIWEAFSQGCPVVASTDRDIPEQVAGAAVPCDPQDPEDIARGIHRVWTDEALRSSLAARGRARYEQARRESLFSGWETVLQ